MLSESYKNRLRELGGISEGFFEGTKKTDDIPFPGVYSILTKSAVDKAKKSNRPASFKVDGNHFEYKNIEELEFLKRRYPEGGTYNYSNIIGVSTNPQGFGLYMDKAGNNCSIGSSHEERMNESIYKYYVSTHEDNNFKPSYKEEFDALLRGKLVQIKTIEFDKKNKYRMADSKDVWFDKNGQKLGEVYKEKKDPCTDEIDNLEVYWINTSLIKNFSAMR